MTADNGKTCSQWTDEEMCYCSVIFRRFAAGKPKCILFRQFLEAIHLNDIKKMRRIPLMNFNRFWWGFTCAAVKEIERICAARWPFQNARTPSSARIKPIVCTRLWYFELVKHRIGSIWSYENKTNQRTNDSLKPTWRRILITSIGCKRKRATKPDAVLANNISASVRVFFSGS